MNPSHPLTIRRLGAIEQALRGQALNLHDIADAVFMSWRWAREYVNYLHAEGKVHIVDWQVRSAAKHDYPVALYRWGAGRDKRKPKPLTYRQKGIKLRAQRNADADKRDAFLARQRALRRKVKVDPLVSALFGRAAA